MLEGLAIMGPFLASNPIPSDSNALPIPSWVATLPSFKLFPHRLVDASKLCTMLPEHALECRRVLVMEAIEVARNQDASLNRNAKLMKLPNLAPISRLIINNQSAQAAHLISESSFFANGCGTGLRASPKS